MAQDWQIPDDAICPDEPTCMYCGKICGATEVIYTGDDDSYAGFELWCRCDDCQEDTFHKIVKMWSAGESCVSEFRAAPGDTCVSKFRVTPGDTCVL